MSDSQLDSIIRQRRLKSKERHAVAEWLLKESKNGVVKHGSLKQAAELGENEFDIKKVTYQCHTFNYVHIDEKWFFLSKKSEKFYLLPEEQEPNPYRSCKSKNFITKVMFMVVVARPRLVEDGTELFLGKIGIFPFVFKEPAKRNSKNRRFDQNGHFRSQMLLQQDNARPHLSVNDLHFTEASRQDEFDFRLCFQPPNSPDLNVLDLGYFRAIQFLQHQMAPKTIDELVNVVEKSFNDMTVERLNHVFLTLQSFMVKVMKDKGGNNYNVPHMKKDMLERQGTLPTQVCCDIGIVNEALALL
ncbi:uncharacterized protein [Nicotiana sylvestris]|uniref:uncharacterized protein n=1 Tax=Nicotiana sylvestris TaxID=4096 RepID=UPI00388C3913